MADLLLIEDNPDLRSVIRDAVEMQGYRVTTARDGQEGVTLLEQGYRPQVILCDVLMPHLDGLSFVSRIRGIPDLAGTTIIGMSGSSAMKQEVLDAGANFYLTKPFSFVDLYGLLNQIHDGT